jgi:hypothetical protein
MLLSELTTPGAVYNPDTARDAMALTADDLRTSILEVIDVQKGDKTALRAMRKPALARLAAITVWVLSQKSTASKGPRPRKPVETRAQRKARGTRKYRRMYGKARSYRGEPQNIHYRATPAEIFAARGA